MSVNTAGTLGLVASIVLIILLYVKVLPRKMDGKIDRSANCKGNAARNPEIRTTKPAEIAVIGVGDVG